MKTEPKFKSQGPQLRRFYVAPKLTDYGLVRDLTKAGSGSVTENTMMNGLCQSNTNRKPCSERSVKENIVRIGDHPLGFGLYLFDYRLEFQERWGQGRQFGVMIDEVEPVVPEAVSMHPDGYKRIDYAVLGITRLTH